MRSHITLCFSNAETRASRRGRRAVHDLAGSSLAVDGVWLRASGPRRSRVSRRARARVFVRSFTCTDIPHTTTTDMCACIWITACGCFFYINISRVCVHSVCTCVHVYQVEGMHYRQIWINTGNTVNILEQTKIVVYQWKDEPPHLLKTFCITKTICFND